MTADEWNRLQAIAGGALDLPVGEQAGYLDRACGMDAELRRRVEELVEASGEAEEFFDRALGSLASEMLADPETISDPAKPQPLGLAPRIEAGQRLGRYVIEGVVGGGGMGVAYSAHDTELDRDVVLKFVRRPILESAETAADEGAEDQVREAKAASGLNHPYIVTIHEVLRTEFGVAIVMEMVKGEALRTLCGQAQPLGKVLRIGEQMAEALAAAGGAGIVHSDIKPENVVLRPDGYIKILDFGLARRAEAVAMSHAAVLAGSYRYMSPEQTRGERLTPASDVFSLATVLFELATGMHPFAGETALQAMMAIGGSEPKVLADLDPAASKEFSDLLRQMMAKDPAARPGAHEVAARLLAMRKDGTRGQVGGKRGLSWKVMAVIGTAALMAAGGVALWRDAGARRSEPIAEPVPFARNAREASSSPDGLTVAYTCLEHLQSQICIKERGAGSVEKFGKRGSSNPVWSPDGQTLAYLTVTGMEQAAIVLRKLADGTERTLTTIGTSAGLYGRSMRWSAEGDGLIVSAKQGTEDSFALFYISTNSGELRQLTAPVPVGRPFGDRGPALSPDGRWLAFNRVQAEGLSDLYVLALDAHATPVGEARKLETGRAWNMTPAWTADGKELVFSTGTLRQRRLARIPVFEKAPATLIPLSMVGSVDDPVIGKNSAGRPVLLFTSALSITNLWEARVGGAMNAAALQLTSPSNSRDFQPSYAHDGKRFAFVSDRSGYEEVWVAEANGANPTQWTHMECGKVAIPRWSPDSSRITFSAVCGDRGKIYVTAGPGQKPVPLTEAGALNENSRWFPDGQWLYFTSFQKGISSTWKVKESGGPAVPLNERVSSNPQASWDGKDLYFTKATGTKLGLWKTPVDHPFDEELVLEKVGDYVVGRQGVYFTAGSVGSGTEIRLLDFGTGRISSAAVVPELQYIFDVSGDGKKIIYAGDHLATEDVFQVDGFR
jgi:Tol biopolymer transport system component